MSSAAQIAIEKLKQLHAEIDSMESKNFDQADGKIGRWYARTRKTIDTYVSNQEANDFEQFRQTRILNGYDYDENDLLEDIVTFYKNKIEVLIEELEQRPESVLDPSLLTIRPTTGAGHVLELIHPQIAEVAGKRFDSGEYADAVLAAFKAVNNRVKAHYKRAIGVELDGTALMQKAFARDPQVIRLGELDTVTGADIQDGYRFIFAGSMSAIRNPKAHDEVKIDSKRAIHFLYLASLQMFKLDEAGVQP